MDVQKLWDEREDVNHPLATTDEKVWKEFACGAGVEKLKLYLYFSESWKNEDHLFALAQSLQHVELKEDESHLFAQICLKLCSRTDLKDVTRIMSVMFSSESFRKTFFSFCVENPTHVSCRKDASFCLVKLCLASLRDAALDALITSFARSLPIPTLRLLKWSLSVSPCELQTAVNAAQITACRCSSQSRDRQRRPDDVVLFAENGVFDAIGEWLLGHPESEGPMMNAVQGLMVSPFDSLGLIPLNGPLMKALRQMRQKNRQAAQIIDAVELTTFKKTVSEKAKESGDGGASLGGEMLGIVGMAEGPKRMAGFEFTNKEIEKDFKNVAFKEGVLRPMAQKMEEEGEVINVDNIAKSVLQDFTKPKTGCYVDGCMKEGTKRCGACKQALYCSPEHQKQHWPEHKKNCTKK